MIESEIITFISNQGIGVAVAMILLYDKIKTNGSLKTVVENNNSLLKEIKDKICKEG